MYEANQIKIIQDSMDINKNLYNANIKIQHVNSSTKYLSISRACLNEIAQVIIKHANNKR